MDQIFKECLASPIFHVRPLSESGNVISPLSGTIAFGALQV